MMSPLEKIQNLLINDDIPSQELINYLVDDVVDDMSEKYLTRRGNKNNSIASDMGALIDSSRTLVSTNNTLTIYAKKKDFDQVFEMLNISLERYTPYVNIDDKSDPLDQGQHNPRDAESVIPFGFCLKLQITPQMKLHQKLQNNLDQKIESKPKIKI